MEGKVRGRGRRWGQEAGLGGGWGLGRASALGVGPRRWRAEGEVRGTEKRAGPESVKSQPERQ